MSVGVYGAPATEVVVGVLELWQGLSVIHRPESHNNILHIPTLLGFPLHCNW